ncbi:MAG: hypothetical protein AAB408_04135 [Patescibacteria group bacterium]
MKVLKKGSENTNFGKEFVCKGYGLGKGVGGCGALLHLVPADVLSSTDWEGDSMYWFVCPECHAKTYMKHDAFK